MLRNATKSSILKKKNYKRTKKDGKAEQKAGQAGVASFVASFPHLET